MQSAGLRQRFVNRYFTKRKVMSFFRFSILHYIPQVGAGGSRSFVTSLSSCLRYPSVYPVKSAISSQFMHLRYLYRITFLVSGLPIVSIKTFARLCSSANSNSFFWISRSRSTASSLYRFTLLLGDVCTRSRSLSDGTHVAFSLRNRSCSLSLCIDLCKSGILRILSRVIKLITLPFHAQSVCSKPALNCSKLL